MGWFRKTFKKIKKSIKKNAKRAFSKEYLTGKKGSWLGHLIYAPVPGVSVVSDALHAGRKLKGGLKSKDRALSNVQKYASGTSRHKVSLPTGNSAAAAPMLTRTQMGNTGFHRYV